jgi:TRAP-type uncharacterized transport system fused permease subunit
MNEKVIGILVVFIVIIAAFYALITMVTKTQIDPKKESEKSDEKSILNTLQKIEQHAFGIKIGIYVIIIYAFVLRIL